MSTLPPPCALPLACHDPAVLRSASRVAPACSLSVCSSSHTLVYGNQPHVGASTKAFLAFPQGKPHTDPDWRTPRRERAHLTEHMG